ncbi:MAG TPA: uridine kinase [bacterium]|nr:uridine kinase [bacterium]
MSETTAPPGAQPAAARHVASRFAAQTLASARALRESDNGHTVAILPDANVVKIGAQSLIDRGRAAVYPVVEELGENAARHKLIIGVGAGTRARHVYDLGADLGLPTGLLAILGAGISEQNALMISTLMGRYNAIRIPKEQFDELPMYLAAGSPVVVTGMPSYHWWEPPPRVGRVPEHRTDCGMYLIAEVFGCRSMIFIKDEDGLYTDDPKKNPRAEFIPRISAQELIRRDLNDLVVERRVVEMMLSARFARQIQVINGLKPGNITRALAGEHVGTIIYVEDEPAAPPTGGQ